MMLTPHPSECNPLWFTHHHCGRTKCQGPLRYRIDLTSITFPDSLILSVDLLVQVLSLTDIAFDFLRMKRHSPSDTRFNIRAFSLRAL